MDSHACLLPTDDQSTLHMYTQGVNAEDAAKIEKQEMSKDGKKSDERLKQRLENAASNA